MSAAPLLTTGRCETGPQPGSAMLTGRTSPSESGVLWAAPRRDQLTPQRPSIPFGPFYCRVILLCAFGRALPPPRAEHEKTGVDGQQGLSQLESSFPILVCETIQPINWGVYYVL